MEAIPNEMKQYESIAGLNPEQILSIYNKALDLANTYGTTMQMQIDLYYEVITKLGQLSDDFESLQFMVERVNTAIQRGFDSHSVVYVLSAMGWLATNGEAQKKSIFYFVNLLINYKASEVLPIVKKIPAVAMYTQSNKSTISVLSMAIKGKAKYISSRGQLGLSENEFSLLFDVIGAENSIAIALYYAKVNQLATISEFLQTENYIK